MTLVPQNNQNCKETLTTKKLCKLEQKEQILCPHCRRTANNGIKCKGVCVADSDY